MAQSSRGISLGIVVLALVGLGGVLLNSINQVSQELPQSATAQPRQAMLMDQGSRLQLHEAAEVGDTAAIAKAVATGAQVDGLLENGGKSGMTPLMCGAIAGKPESVAALLKAGAKVSARGKDGKTALIFAAGWANAATVQAVLDGKPNIDERTDDRLTALCLCLILLSERISRSEEV